MLSEKNPGVVEQRIAVDRVVNDMMAYYVRRGDPILKLGFSVAKHMVKERVAQLAKEWDNKRVRGKIPKPVVDTTPKPRQIINRFSIGDDGVVRHGTFKR